MTAELSASNVAPARDAKKKEVLLRGAEFGARVGLCASTITRYGREGRIKRVVLNPRVIRYPMTELAKITDK